MRHIICISLISLAAAINAFGQKSTWEKVDLIDTIVGYNYSMDKIASFKYGPDKLFDGDLKTCWVAGEGAIYLRIPLNTKVLNVFNGYGKSPILYHQNARAKKIIINYYIGVQPEGHVSEIAAEYYLLDLHVSQEVDFFDVMGIRHIALKDSVLNDKTIVEEALTTFTNDIGYNVNAVNPIIKITITDTYPGSKYDDICISELFYSDKYIIYNSKQQISSVDSLYINEEENALLAHLSNGQVEVLYKNTDDVIWLSEVSKDQEWVTIMTMPIESRGRGLSKFLLINSATKSVVNDDLQASLGIRLGAMFLEYQGDDLFLKCTDATSHDDMNIKLK